MRKIIAAIVAASGAALAQEVKKPVEGTLHGRLGIDFTTQYFFRGIQQENQGIIAQPWIKFGYDLHDGQETDGVRDVALTFGLWNSLHDGPTGGSGSIWYESQFSLDLSAKFGERWRGGVVYTGYNSPNGNLAFSTGTVQELAFYASYDDRGAWFEDIESGLQPSILVAFELDRQRDGGQDEGIYCELGLAPSFGIGHLGDDELRLVVPVRLGLSLKDYYERVGGGNSDFFGFLDVGAVAAAPLSFLPNRLGPWRGELGLHLLLLGDNNKSRNGGDSVELILTFGLSTVF